jgi:hypothetical protein
MLIIDECHEAESPRESKAELSDEDFWLWLTKTTYMETKPNAEVVTYNIIPAIRKTWVYRYNLKR